MEFGGQTTWRRPTEAELRNFYQKYKDEGTETGLWTARGWPTSSLSWSSTNDGSKYPGIALGSGAFGILGPSSDAYASCI
ncbi:hypothetical protein CGK40_22985, partial [Vibrio parahaemolyticus]